MPTKLHKPVTRETASATRAGQSLIVTLAPGDVIQFRLKGHKRTVSVSLGHCYNLAQIISAENHYNEKVKKYESDRKFKKGLRKPKRGNLPFSKVYYNAFNK